ncbi:MAG: FGGY family carbohydrate kinase [bacterium]
MASRYILVLCQRSTFVQAVIYDRNGTVIAQVRGKFSQLSPKPGWVEYDPIEIWSTQIAAAGEALEKANLQAGKIIAMGITNQRDTTIVWDKKSGEPLYNAISSSCRRTTSLCKKLQEQGLAEQIGEKTGLGIETGFSAPKIAWILDNVPGVREKAQKGEALFGTIDSWLIWKITGKKVHAIDYTNAARTMIFNINNLSWDEELLRLFNIPHGMLPQVYPSSFDYGLTTRAMLGEEIPITAAIGDQQALLFGQACFAPGFGQASYNHSINIMVNAGEQIPQAAPGLLSTVAYGAEGQVKYALEGRINGGCLALKWLQDDLRLLANNKQAEEYAQKVADTGGVYLVPAFTGLDLPYGDPNARGIIVGINRTTKREHLVRAALEAIAFQTRDLVEAIIRDGGIKVKGLRLAGEVVAGSFLPGYMADILGIPMQRSRNIDPGALGAAYLSGLTVGFWKSMQEIAATWKADAEFKPRVGYSEREDRYKDWQRAVERSRDWYTEKK